MSPPALTLLLMRHGATVRESPWRFLGRRDAPLSDAGRAQASLWTPALATAAIELAWSSDLSRCRETASLALADCAPTARELPGLREISLGEWDGLTIDEVRARHPGAFEARGADLANFRPPGGESFADVAARALETLDFMTAEARRAGVARMLAVAHAGFNRALICALLGMEPGRVFSLGQDHGCLNVVRLGAGPPVVQALNLPPGSTLNL